MTNLLMGRRRLNAGAFFFVAALTPACFDAGPLSTQASIAMAPTFSQDALRSYARAHLVGLTLDNLHVVIARADGERVIDNTTAIAVGQDSIVIEATVRLNTSPERLKAVLELRFGQLVLFSGSGDIVAVAGSVTPVPLITMSYVGPIDPKLPPLPPIPLAVPRLKLP